MTGYDLEWIVIQVASTDPDAKTIANLMYDALKLVHASESEIRIESSEFSFGWHFHQIAVARSTVGRLAQIPGSEMATIKGDSIEQKFVNWLNRQAKNMGIDERLHFTLMSDLKSSRYGFF